MSISDRLDRTPRHGELADSVAIAPPLSDAMGVLPAPGFDHSAGNRQRPAGFDLVSVADAGAAIAADGDEGGCLLARRVRDDESGIGYQ